jgi:hypothetical protein
VLEAKLPLHTGRKPNMMHFLSQFTPAFFLRYRPEPKLWIGVRALIKLGQRGMAYDVFNPGEFLPLHFTPSKLRRRTYSQIGRRLSEQNLSAFIKRYVLAEAAVILSCTKYHQEQDTIDQKAMHKLKKRLITWAWSRLIAQRNA